MEQVLSDINALSGVIGSFVCDEEGQPLASALPEIYDPELLSRAGGTAAETLAGLWMARQRRVGDVDLRFSDGRLIIKGLEGACLCILCTPRLNLPLLNLTANLAVKKLQREISGARSRPAARPKRERLVEVVQGILGDRSKRVVEMLSSAKAESPEALSAICDEAVRFTGFFMSKEKAEELSRRMRAIIEE